MTNEELHERFNDCMYYGASFNQKLSMVGYEKLLDLFDSALDLMENEPGNGRNMWHRLDAVIGYLFDCGLIDWAQDNNLCELAEELCRA